MGCDIHGPFIEVQDGPLDPEWRDVAELGLVWRDYRLFVVLAGVRANTFDPPIEPVVAVRGWPERPGSQLEDHIRKNMGDCHHASWLTLDEVRDARRRYMVRFGDISQPLDLIVKIMEHEAEAKLFPVRVAFCFDN